MSCRRAVWSVLLCLAVRVDAQGIISAWWPLQPGDRWVYAKESLDGDMDHPSVERWTTEETIVSVAPAPGFDATLVTRRIRVLDHSVPPDFIAANDATKRELPETHLLVRRSCVYVLDGPDAQAARYVRDPLHSAEFRADFLRGEVPADFCFPMTPGKQWGRVTMTSPAEEYIWRVDRMNGDPYDEPGARTFHLETHIGSGEYMDRWFTEGIGVVQENAKHHGTYEERRRRLLRSTIAGKSRGLRPAAGAHCTAGRRRLRGTGMAPLRSRRWDALRDSWRLPEILVGVTAPVGGWLVLLA